MIPKIPYEKPERTGENKDDPLFTLIDRITEAFVVQDVPYLLISEDYFDGVCDTSIYFANLLGYSEEWTREKRLEKLLEILSDLDLEEKHGMACFAFSSSSWGTHLASCLWHKYRNDHCLIIFRYDINGTDVVLK